ncbi:MAG: hypothetical protein IJP62_02870 [Treponema sp.]|nr:hypothetical protein [Treponema sp.]
MNRKNAILCPCAVIAAFLIIAFCMGITREGIFSRNHTSFTYHHDPCENPEAMKDIVVNPKAVYGFSPSPTSKRLGNYVDSIDWTDPVQVAKAREQRAAYHESMTELYQLIGTMLQKNKSIEEIARAVSKRRNEIRLKTYVNDPEGLRLVMKSNLENFGHELGPEPDELFKKYGSWRLVLEKAMNTNAGMDACLGFYDDFYRFYNVDSYPEKAND